MECACARNQRKSSKVPLSRPWAGLGFLACHQGSEKYKNLHEILSIPV
jgi:hypothetical protein